MSTRSRTTRFLALVVALLLTAMGTLPATAQTMEEAKAAYTRGDHATALRGFRAHAERGDAEAQLILGILYDEGEDVPQDHAEALQWYRRAAEQGHPDAQFMLALMYAEGEDVLQDYAEALRWYRRAAGQGHADAQFNLGFLYRKGHGVPQNYAEAARWYRRAAEQGHAGAQFNLGLMYDSGYGVPRDHVEAVRWYRRAAEQGHAGAQFNLGLMYDGGYGVPQDHAEAARWYRRAAEQGHAGAQLNLGVMYAKGEGVPQDHAEAARWYRRAAEQGHASAQFNLGLRYDNGYGVPQDYAEALRWYRQAAEQGHAGAQNNLGIMYEDGAGVHQDHGKAARWYRLAAEQGHAGAQFNLGLMYDGGYGVPQDHAEAARWYRRAAEQGHAGAQLNLGVMYAKGEGVPQDHVEAARWYRRAAEQGHASAQFNLGLRYDNGYGVPQDYVEALRWYRQAAEQGHVGAQNNLGIMYEDGAGVPHDFVQAHKWYNLAASRASSSDQYLREKAVRSRDRIAARLTPAQLTRAQRLAREWQPRTSTVEPPVHEQRPSTSAALTPRAPNTEAESTRNRIANLQRALRRLGYDPGPVDGILGARTRAAIRAFQADTGLPVTGRISERLESAVLAAIVAAGQTSAPTPELTHPPFERESTGSGFRVSSQGHVLTNAHVVRGCTELRTPPDGVAEVMARDDSSDLALLRAPVETDRAVAKFRQGRGIRPGASVVVMGYPLRGLLASEANVSTGAVSALAGPGDDRRLIQITAPVQPGNSGGPVLDAAGNVVGVVVAKLNAIRIARSTGDIPQNVNFAISAGATRAFLDAEGVPYETAPSDNAVEPVEVAAAARKFTVLVECWK